MRIDADDPGRGGDASSVSSVDARSVIDALDLRAHPEGGWFAETWRAEAPDGGRPTGSAILYLLATGEHSAWHRVDADEIWQYSAGDPLELRVWAEGDELVTVHHLGGNLSEGSVVQVVVPAGAWQAAAPLGAWTLVGCVVTPAFRYEGFELASSGWEPPAPAG